MKKNENVAPMTREQLVAAISCRLGLSLREKASRGDRLMTLVALSPHGTELFTIDISRSSDGGWRFVGCGALLTKEWNTLIALGRIEE